MKSYIIGIAIFIVGTIIIIFQQDYNLHQEMVYRLKFAGVEVAASAAQYLLQEEYANGRIIFNQVEGRKAAEYVVEKQLKLDEYQNPLPNSYWTEKVNYRIEYFDDGNSVFPLLYSTNNDEFVITISEPTVIVFIDAGKPRYRMFNNVPRATTISVHEWKSR